MTTSILTDVKKALGLEENYTAFDPDILMHINSVLSAVTQIGVGPENGFMIEDKAATWDELLNGDPRFNLVKSYIYIKVRLLFDPPATSFAIEALKSQAAEFEFRMYVTAEGDVWVP